MSTSSSSVRSEVLSVSLAEVFEVSGADALYQDEGFEEDSDRQVSLVTMGEAAELRGSGSGNGGDDDAYDDDTFEDEPASLEDNYSDDAFEEEARGCQDDGEADATDDFRGPQGEVHDFQSYDDESFEADAAAAEAVHSSEACELRAGDQELEPTTVSEVCGVASQTTHDPPTLTLRHKWYSDRIKALSAGKAHHGLAVQSSNEAVAHTIPAEACHALRQQLLRKYQQLPTANVHRRDRRTRSSEKLATGASLPVEFIDKMLCNANTKRLLHTSFDRMVSSDAAHDQSAKTLPPPQKRHLGTFCTVKRTDLEGKLATIRFEDHWTRTCTTHASETNEMSIGTLALVQEMMAAQRKILHCSPHSSGPARETLFSCMHTRAPCLDLTVESTKRCLEDSRLLRERASKVLYVREETQPAAAS